MAKGDEGNSGTAQDAQKAEGGHVPRVNWSTDGLKSTYCNFVNATSTREEVVLNFGVNENWDRMSGEVEISLDHRIILSPFAAKRLSGLLEKLLGEYENRYGELK